MRRNFLYRIVMGNGCVNSEKIIFWIKMVTGFVILLPGNTSWGGALKQLIGMSRSALRNGEKDGQEYVSHGLNGGVSKEITHISYARQGLDREPTIHLGARVKTLEDRGLLTDRSKKNRDI